MLEEAVSKVQQQLQKYWISGKSISWSWVLLKMVDTLNKYPSGVTETILVSELYLKLLSSGGKLSTARCSSNRRNTVAAILERKVVPYEAVLEVVPSQLWTIPGTTTKVVALCDPAEEEGESEGVRHVEMYLHRKFYNSTPSLMSHSLRITGCRLHHSSLNTFHSPLTTSHSHLTTSHSHLTTSHTPFTTSHAPFTTSHISLKLLPSEEMVILLNIEEEREMRKRFSALSEVTASEYAEASYIRDIYAKVGEEGEEEVVHSPDGTPFRRLVVNVCWGEYSVQLILWDQAVGLGMLWQKGDVLFLERPYARPLGARGREGENWCLETGPATILYLSPFIPEEEVVPSQLPTVPVHVTRTDDGDLDFSSFPHRLMVADVVLRMVNGTMLVYCERVEETMEGSADRIVAKFLLQVKDNTGSIACQVWSGDDSRGCSVFADQWLVLSGLSCLKRVDTGTLSLCCDTRREGSISNISNLVGLLNSPFLHTPTTTSEAMVCGETGFRET